MQLIRLQKILSQAGIASRRKAEEYIVAGRVTVDGKTVNALGLKANPYKNRICFDGKSIRFEKKVYILLNKPKGYICTSQDTHGRPIVLDLIKGVKENVYTVGRLDKDTEGLLILTNDGKFSHKLLHPSFKVDKTYKIQLDKKILLDDIKKLEKGILLEGKKTSPCKIKTTKSPKQIYTTIHEGRKRQIRKMMETVGYKVVKLKRTEFNGLNLGTLKTGKYRHLDNSELKKLKLL